MVSDGDVYIMGDFNIDLRKCESSQISQDFLLFYFEAVILCQQWTNRRAFIDFLLVD